MTTVIVPADQAHLLLPSTCETCAGKGVRINPDSVGRAFAAVLNHGRGAGVEHLRCSDCEGRATRSPLCDIVVHDEPVDPGTVITLAVRCMTGGERGHASEFWLDACPDCTRGNRPVGTATVTECLPINDRRYMPDHARQVTVNPATGMVRLWGSPLSGDDTGIADRVVGTPQPEQYALILTDAVAT